MNVYSLSARKEPKGCKTLNVYSAVATRQTEVL